MSPGILTLIYPLLIFGYAAVRSPKADQKFWNFIIFYTSSLMLAEFIMSMHFWHEEGKFNA